MELAGTIGKEVFLIFIVWYYEMTRYHIHFLKGGYL